jgi:hypothetical protein
MLDFTNANGEAKERRKRVFHPLLLVALASLLALAILVAHHLITFYETEGKLSSLEDITWKHKGKRVRVIYMIKREGERMLYRITVMGSDNERLYDRNIFIYHGSLNTGGFVKAVQVDHDPELEILVWGDVTKLRKNRSTESVFSSMASDICLKCYVALLHIGGKRISFYPMSYGESVQLSAENTKLYFCRTNYGGLGPDSCPNQRNVDFTMKRSFYLDYHNGTVVERPFCEASQQAKTLVTRWKNTHLSTPILLLKVLIGGILLLAFAFSVGWYVVSRRKVLAE